MASKNTDTKFSGTQPVGNNGTKKEDMGVANLWQDFTQHTGFHAFNKLNPERSHKLRFLLWSVVVMGMAGYLMYTVVAELKNYYSYPKMTVFSLDTKQEIEFPAVTVCNQCPLNASAFDMNESLSNYFLSQTFVGLNISTINWNDTTTYGEFYTTQHSVDWWRGKYGTMEMMGRMCVFQGISMWCPDMFQPVFTKVGLCYTFNGNISNRRNASLAGADNNLKVLLLARQEHYVYNEQLSAGFKILLHDPEVHPDAVTNGILVSPGFSTYVSMRKTTFNYLPSPFKAFGESECVDTSSPSFNNSLKYHQHYTYEHCLLECAADFLFSQCGCVMPNDPPLAPICSLKAQAECYVPMTKRFRTNVTARAYCACQEVCSSTAYNVQISTAAFPSLLWNNYLLDSNVVPTVEYARNNAMEIRIFFSDMMVETVQQLPVYQTATIAANLGGQMGICLGASVLTLTELGEFFVFLFMHILHSLKAKSNGKRISAH